MLITIIITIIVIIIIIIIDLYSAISMAHGALRRKLKLSSTII